jgi:GTP-dependent dephospho-CoA kinase
LREELKKPQGLLIEGPFEETMKRLKELVDEEKPSLIISVGDIVSSHMVEQGISLDVLLVDNKTMRKPIQPIVVDVDQTLYAQNPPGAITDEAWAAIRQAIGQKGRTKVIIDGEEDLLTIVTVLSAPVDAFVVYGQPQVGVVVVKVTEETQERMRRIADSMADSSKS